MVCVLGSVVLNLVVVLVGRIILAGGVGRIEVECFIFLDCCVVS